MGDASIALKLYTGFYICDALIPHFLIDITHRNHI